MRLSISARSSQSSADQCRTQHIWIGAGVGDHEVLATGLPYQPRIGPIAADVGSDPLPQVLEGLCRAGEMNAGEIGVNQCDFGDLDAVTGQHVDHAGR